VAGDAGGWLCMACAKALGKDLKKATAPRKRKPAQKRQIVHFEQAEPVKTLTNMCIDVSYCRLLKVQVNLQSLLGHWEIH